MSDYKRFTEFKPYRQDASKGRYIQYCVTGCYNDMNHKGDYTTGESVDRLAELENGIEQGYIKILPVRAGDKIYVVPSKASYGINRMHKTFKENNKVYTQTVDEIRFFKDGVYMVYSCEYQQNHHSEFFGETWFLEYKQAANRLKEMEAIYAKYDHKGGDND